METTSSILSDRFIIDKPHREGKYMKLMVSQLWQLNTLGWFTLTHTVEDFTQRLDDLH